MVGLHHRSHYPVLLLAAFSVPWLTSLAGCGVDVHNRETALLTWRSANGAKSSKADEVEYLLDGRPMGNGEQGFLNAVEAIRERTMVKELWVYPDVWVEQLLDSATDCNEPAWLDRETDPVPFRRKLALVKKLSNVASEQSITIWHLAKPPGGLRWETGEDVRISNLHEWHEDRTTQKLFLPGR